MFYCQSCNELSQPTVGSNKLVTEIRPKVYENKVHNKIKISNGWEIVKEITVCKTCYDEVQSDSTESS